MSHIAHYTIHSTGHRNITGFYQEDTSIELDFTFPINEDGGNRLVIENPSFKSFDGEHNYVASDGAADILDDFVSLKYDVRVRYNPTPEHNQPRLTIHAEATPERIFIY